MEVHFDFPRPPGTSQIEMHGSVQGALADADAVVIGAVDPKSYPLDAPAIKTTMRRALVIDQGALYRELAGDGVEYVTFGKPS